MSWTGKEHARRAVNETLPLRLLGNRSLTPFSHTDSYFGVVSSAQEAHAILEASKLGVSLGSALSLATLFVLTRVSFASASPASNSTTYRRRVSVCYLTEK